MYLGDYESRIVSINPAPIVGDKISWTFPLPAYLVRYGILASFGGAPVSLTSLIKGSIPVDGAVVAAEWSPNGELAAATSPPAGWLTTANFGPGSEVVLTSGEQTGLAGNNIVPAGGELELEVLDTWTTATLPLFVIFRWLSASSTDPLRWWTTNLTQSEA